MLYLSPDDYWVDIFKNLWKLRKNFAIPIDDRIKRDMKLALNILDINSDEFDQKYINFQRSENFKVTKSEFFKKIENILIRLSLANNKPKIYLTPNTYGLRFRVLFNETAHDLTKRLILGQTSLFKDNKYSSLDKMSPSTFEFIFCTKDLTILEIFHILEKYNTKESPLNDSFALQIVADKCLTVDHLKKLNTLVKKHLFVKMKIFHVLEGRFSNLNIKTIHYVNKEL